MKDILPNLSALLSFGTRAARQANCEPLKRPRAAGLQLAVSTVIGLKDLDSAFDGIKKARAEGLVILASPIFTAQRARLTQLTATHRLPAIYYHEGFAESGGLLAYGPKLSEFNWYRAATFIDKILKGAKPADLPVEQPTKFDFIVNLKTAKQIGLTIPPNVLARADRVIR